MEESEENWSLERRPPQFQVEPLDESSISPSNETNPTYNKIVPYSKKLKVIDLKLSNEDFMTVIEKDLNNSDAKKVHFDGSVHPSDHLLAIFSSRVYNEEANYSNPLEKGWVLLTTASSNDGYFGAAYWNPDCLQVVLAHKGTKNLKDVWADFWGVFIKTYTPQMSSAATFSKIIAEQLEKLSRKYSTHLTFSITGHSLGGWLAQISAFTTKYLTSTSSEGEEEYFVKSDQEGCHSHTVVFDSPGCKDMLLKLENDFNPRYEGKNNLSSFLDITIYLSAPNLVNTRNPHLNIVTLYRVFIEDIPVRTSRWDFFKFTRKTHKMDAIRKVFAAESSNKIMRITDWPLSDKGLIGSARENILTRENEYEQYHREQVKSFEVQTIWSRMLSFIFESHGVQRLRSWSASFFHLITKHNFRTPGDRVPRYRVEEIKKEQCSANIFKQSEYDFLVGSLEFKRFSKLFIVLDLTAPLNEMTNGKITRDQVENLLQNFEIIEGVGRGVIKSSSEEYLTKLISYVKIILFLTPKIHIELRDKLDNLFFDTYGEQTFNYLEKIKSLELKNITLKNIANFLNSDLQFLNIEFKSATVIGMKKVHKVVNENLKENQLTKAFFLSLEHLLTLEQFFSLNEFIEKLNEEISVLFVIECNTECTKAATLFKNLFKIKDKPKIKFILVSQKVNDLNDILEENKNLYAKSIDDETITLKDLTDESRLQIVEKTVYFQVEQTSLSSLLIDEKANYLIDEETILKLINNERLEIGETFGYLDNEASYMNRTFYRHTIIKNDIQRNNIEFYFTYNNEIDKSKLNRSQDIVLISETDVDFYKLCDENENHSVHWLRENTDNFEWAKSRGSLGKLRKYFDTASIKEYFEIHDSTAIISAASGAGKSTLLTKLALDFKKSDPSLWVMRINLNSHTEKLASLELRKNDNIYEFLQDILNIKTNLEKKLFQDRLNSQGKIAFMVDGFDEIAPDYENKIIELLKILKKSKMEKLWITTRTHKVHLLEENLNIFSYNIKPLSKEEQKVLLEKYLGNFSKPNEGIFNGTAMILLNYLSASISGKNYEFTGVPLHIKMLAEAFKSDNFPINFFKDLKVTYLYKLFVESKYTRHLKERKILDITKVGPEYKLLREMFLKKYSLFALNAIFDKNVLSQILYDEEKDELMIYMKQIKDGEENSGFISNIVEEKPVFIHYSFAEYFVALFYANNITREEVKNHVRKEIFEPGKELRRSFFDCMLINNKEECKLHIAILNKDKLEFELLISNANEEEYTRLMNHTDRVGRTALHLAAAYGYWHVTNSLIKLKFSLDKLFKWTPLEYAIGGKQWETVDRLLEAGAKIDDTSTALKKYENYTFHDDFEQKTTLLHEASEKGLIRFLDALIKIRKDLVNAVDEFGRTPLHVAETLKVVQLLIKQGADMNAKDKNGQTPLHSVIKKYLCSFRIEIIKYLIKHESTDIEAEDYEGNTPLSLAVKERKRYIVGSLLKQGVSVNCEGDYFRALLILGVIDEKVEYLSEQIKSELSFDKDFYSNINEPLTEAKLNINIVKQISKSESIPDVNNIEDELGFTPLFIATINGNIESVKDLILKGAAVDARDKIGFVPLHYSVINNDERITELLLQTKANFLPLFLMLGSQFVRDSLVMEEASAGNYFLFTPLHFAAFEGKKVITELLVTKGSFVDARDPYGCTPLHYAALAGNEEVTKLLLEREADVKARCYCYLTPLHYSVLKNQDNVSKLLIENGADINEENWFYPSLLHIAVMENNVQSVEFLLRQGADIEAQDGAGCTPLHYAALFANKEVACLLIIKKADVEAKKDGGESPLHLAALSNNEEVAETLILQGHANLKAENDWGFTPLDLSDVKNNKEMCSLLKKYGAERKIKNVLVDHLFSMLKSKTITL